MAKNVELFVPKPPPTPKPYIRIHRFEPIKLPKFAGGTLEDYWDLDIARAFRIYAELGLALQEAGAIDNEAR